jgi:hypothetical protein
VSVTGVSAESGRGPVRSTGSWLCHWGGGAAPCDQKKKYLSVMFVTQRSPFSSAGVFRPPMSNG